jgi:group I intron endonuclease
MTLTGIYKILNKVNGKFYIGSAIDIKQRWRQHKHYLRLNKHKNIYLQRAWNKYWEQSFDFIVIEECPISELICVEQKWLDLTKCFDITIGYNLTPTAGNSKGVKHTEETRKRMSDAKKKMTQETKEKMRQNNIGKKLTEEHKAKISEGLRRAKIKRDALFKNVTPMNAPPRFVY